MVYHSLAGSKAQVGSMIFYPHDSGFRRQAAISFGATSIYMYMEKVVAFLLQMNRDEKKSVFRVSDQVRHKPDCTTTKDGYRLEIGDLGSKGMVLSM